jgi:uncharacterized membrane protein
MSGKKRIFLWRLSYFFILYLFIAAIFVKFGLSILLDILPLLLIPLYLVHSFLFMGRRDAFLFLFISCAVSLFFEYVGVTTGLPFGRYRYSDFLKPFIGPVPALIPLMWASLGYFCYMASESIIVSSLMMVIIDTALDPRLSPHLWQWVESGIYFGVPPLNFFGWFLTSMTIFSLYRFIAREKTIFHKDYLTLYMLFSLAQAFTDAAVGLYIPSLISASLTFIVTSIYAYKKGLRFLLK